MQTTREGGGEPGARGVHGLKARADFPTGNARILGLHHEAGTPEVHFAALPKGSPVSIWFCLEMDPRGARTAEIRCVLHGFENMLGNGPGSSSEGLNPVFRTEQRDWERTVCVDRDVREDGRVVVSWTVPGDEGVVRVALSYPYGPAELDVLLEETSGRLKADLIGLTPDGTEIERVSNAPGSQSGRRPGVYCLARQHASEAPGSWVLDGFLRRMAREGERAPLVWATPFADPDGVRDGRPGKDSFPYDFNRSWGASGFPKGMQGEAGSHPMRHEILCIQNDLLRWQDRCRPMLVLDFHAPCMREMDGIYCFVRDVDEQGRPDAAHAGWVETFEKALGPELRAERFVRSGRYLSRWNTARVGDFVTRVMNVPEITFETPYGRKGERLLTREDYQNAGDRIAAAVLETQPKRPDGPLQP